METYKVWLQSVGEAAEMRVDGHSHAMSVASRLESDGYAVSAPAQLEGTAHYSLRAGYAPGCDHFRLQRLLTTMAEVELLYE